MKRIWTLLILAPCLVVLGGCSDKGTVDPAEAKRAQEEWNKVPPAEQAALKAALKKGAGEN